MKTANDLCNLGKPGYFYWNIDILRFPNNFTDPRFEFSRISYDFSKLPKILPRNAEVAFLIKCKGKIVNNQCTRGREVNRGGNIYQDIILSVMVIC